MPKLHIKRYPFVYLGSETEEERTYYKICHDYSNQRKYSPMKPRKSKGEERQIHPDLLI